MHFNNLLHVRDHAKVRGTAHHLLAYIALHVNRHTGEAFELSVDRLAHRLDVTPQWVRQLRARLVAAGELEIQQSRGRRLNVYRIPYERCPACRAGNPKLQWPVENNPQQPPAQPESQPETAMSPTRNSDPANPKLDKSVMPQETRISPLKDNVLKEETEHHVNVESNHLNPKRPITLTLREEDLVEELMRRFRDEKSGATYRRIVGALGEDLTYRLMRLAWEVRDRIAVSPGAYFMGIAKNVARVKDPRRKRRGFKRQRLCKQGPLSVPCLLDAMLSDVSADHLRRDLGAHGTSTIALFPAFSTPQTPLDPWELAKAGPGTQTLEPCHDWRDSIPWRERAKDRDMVRTHVPLFNGDVIRLRNIAKERLHPLLSLALPYIAPVLRRPDQVVQGIIDGRGGSSEAHAAIVPPSTAVWQRASSPLPNALIPPRRKQRGSLTAFRPSLLPPQA